MNDPIKIIDEGECVNICIDEDIPVIFEEWLGRVNGPEFRETLEKKLALFKDKKRQYPSLAWLSDIRELRGLAEEDQHWASHEFHRKLFPAGVKKLAYVVAPKTYMRLNDQQVAGFKDDTGLDVCYFDDYKEATSWLKQL